MRALLTLLVRMFSRERSPWEQFHAGDWYSR